MGTASEMYAQAMGGKCYGKEVCHWCGGACDTSRVHDDPPPIPFSRSRTTALRMSSRFMCVGCWFFHMKRISVRFLKGEQKDKQVPQEHSWLVTPEAACAIRPEDHQLLWERLLDPPSKFWLALLTAGKCQCLPQLAVVNDHDVVDLDTELHFTIDNVSYSYTVYELETAIEGGESAGMSSGVRELIRLLRPYRRPEKEVVKRGRGRPKAEENPLTKK